MNTNNNFNHNKNGERKERTERNERNERTERSENNGGYKRVNGETRSRNFANNKRNFNKNNENRRDSEGENSEVKRERFTDNNGERKSYNAGGNRNNNNGRSNYNRNNNNNRNNSSERNFEKSDRGERSNDKPFERKFDRNSENGDRSSGRNGERQFNNNGEKRNNGFVRDNNSGRNFNNSNNKGKSLRSENERSTRAERESSYTDMDLEDDEIENLQLEGRNAVLEAIRIKRPIDKILLKKGDVEGTLKVIKAKAIAQGIIVQETAKSNLDEMAKSHNHQGVIALCSAQEYAEVEDMLELAKERNEDPFIIILDGITDTYNLGAIIRTANASGAHGVIIPKRRAAGLTAMVSKASAGAILYTKVARVTNITTEIEKLKQAGLWIVGTDMKAKSLYETNLKGPVAFVIGSEGTGISRLVKEKCDLKVSVPMLGEIESLNASVAGGVLMYEVVRQRLNG